MTPGTPTASRRSHAWPEAITRYHGRVTSPSQPPPGDEASKAPPLVLELPAPGGRGEKPGPSTAQPVRSPSTSRALARLAIGAGVVAGGAGVAAPAHLSCRGGCASASSTTRRRGASRSRSTTPRSARRGVRLTGVKATSAALPGASLVAPELDVETSGLRPVKLTVRGAELTLAGPWSEVEAAIAKWRAPEGGAGGGGEAAAVALVIDGSRVVWETPAGGAGRIDGADVHVDFALQGGSDVHVRTPHVTVAAPGGQLGPWRVDVDRSSTMSRVRVALDPLVPDSCTALFVGDGARTTHADVVIPRSPPERLGLPPQLLGLHGKALQIEASIHYTDLGAGRAGGERGEGGVRHRGAGPAAGDRRVRGRRRRRRDPRQGMDLKNARLAVGPMVGALTGTAKTFDDGARLDVAWRAGPVPCTAFDAPLGDGEPFDIGYELRRLAEATGVTKITGNVSARATLAVDSRDLSATHVDFKPEVTCQVALFGR